MIDRHRKPQRILGNRKQPELVAFNSGYTHATAQDEWAPMHANLRRARFGRRLSMAKPPRRSDPLTGGAFLGCPGIVLRSLCRKLHGVPPLRDVLNFLTLIDLMNQLG